MRAVIANAFVCRRLAIDPRAIAARLLRSLAVSATSMVGPLAIVALGGFDLRFGVAAALAIAVSAVPGWLFGLWVTDHPLGSEILRALRYAEGIPGRGRLLASFAPLLRRAGAVGPASKTDRES